MSAPGRTSAPITAIINLDVPGPVISRHVYGHFAEHLGRCIYGGFYVGEDSELPNEGGIRLDVVQALRALRIPNLRWPGGCFADEYHWRDGVGPREERPRMVNSHWGDVVEDNAFGTHEFMALCELLGAEPYVNGNLGSGTVREMSDWVEYLTRGDDSPMAALRREHGRDEPWQVKFWGLGNEPWGCGGNMTAAHYAEEARRYATYCRDHGENRLYRIAAGANSDDYAWTETLMKALTPLGGCGRDPRGLYQAVSVHYYTLPGTWQDKGSATELAEEDYYRTLVKAAYTDELLRGHSNVMDCYDPQKKVGLVLDEWGTWWNVEEGTNPGFLYQQNTLRDALVASTHFDIFHAHADRLVMANIAQTVNVLQAMILTDPDSGELVLTPTYHVFQMNADHQDAASLRVDTPAGLPARTVDGEELTTVSASASSKDGRVLISLSNLDARAATTVDLDLRGGAVSDVRARILTAGELHAHNAPGRGAQVRPVDHEQVTATEQGLRVELPAHSFVTVSAAVA